MNDKVKVYDSLNNLLTVHAVDAVEIVKNGGHYPDGEIVEKPKTVAELQAEIVSIKQNQSNVLSLPSVQALLQNYDQQIADLSTRTGNAMSRANSAMSKANNVDAKADDALNRSMIPGETGQTGAQGLKGDTGAQGAQGQKGDRGDAGAQGIPGVNATTTANATTSASGLMSAADKTKLDAQPPHRLKLSVSTGSIPGLNLISGLLGAGNVKDVPITWDSVLPSVPRRVDVTVKHSTGASGTATISGEPTVNGCTVRVINLEATAKTFTLDLSIFI